MITKNAYLVTDVAVDSIGTIVSSTAVAVDVVEADVLGDGQMMLSDGSIIRVEELQSEAKFGTAERVWEEAANRTKLFVHDANQLGSENQPFWLLPATGIDARYHKATVRLDDVNLFKSGNFQLACWSRLVWGTMFFDDPATPVDHTKLAVSLKPSVGDSLPVAIRDNLRGVLMLESEMSEGEFEASVFLLSKDDLSDEDELFLNAVMVCEGIEASFKCKIGSVLKVASSCV